MVLEQLGDADLRAALTTYRDLLRSHQELINRLNVYPVPDGDTGTNMALTIEAVVAEFDSASDMAGTCKAISHGSLMGARGNSGVILSQVLRGIAETLKDLPAGGPEDVAGALGAASDAAYGAVMRPVEGTILTVVKAGASAAADQAVDGAALVAVVDAARAAAADALEQTPDLLPVLKEAGVVDAGGAGFVLFLDALLHVVAGRDLPAPSFRADLSGSQPVKSAQKPIGDQTGELRYEVMYFLEAPDEAIPAFKEVWAGIGDSIVVVGGDGLWNCHIHTDDIGAAVEAALDCGRPRTIRVTDLHEQVEEERWVREAEALDDDAAHRPPDPVPTAVVAVATGAGLRRIFRSLGVHQIVAGGQSMNPSTAQILEAVEAAPAGEVVILPNNKNIIPVAEQVDELSDKTVRVVHTTGVAEGFAALMEYDPQAPVDDNLRMMTESAGRIVSGEVTRAVRATTCPAGPIAEGDYLGIAADGILAVNPELPRAVCALLDALVTADHEMITLIEGEGAGAADTRRITEWLAEHRPGAAVEVHHGGQPLYPYLLSVE